MLLSHIYSIVGPTQDSMNCSQPAFVSNVFTTNIGLHTSVGRFLCWRFVVGSSSHCNYEVSLSTWFAAIKLKTNAGMSRPGSTSVSTWTSCLLS